MALDFSSTRFMLVPSAVVYKSLNFGLESQSKEELKSIDENLKPLELDDKVLKAQEGLKTIYFRDPLTLKITQSALSEESIQILKENFGENDFYQRKDGSFILNGKSEAFVSGWYGDIAYQRGYLASDENKDGFMEQHELDETRSGFITHGFYRMQENRVLEDVSLYAESYVRLNGYSTASDETLQEFKINQKTLYNQGKFAENTLALELDKTIKNDKNIDGDIEYKEALTKNEMIQQSIDSITYMKGNNSIKLDFYSYKSYTLLDLILKDENILKIFNKLEANDFDTTKLSQEELESLKQNLPEFFDENENFKQEEFKEYYQNFKQEFKEKGLSFLGLDESAELDFNKLQNIIKEIAQNFKETNVSGVNFSNFTLDLKA